MKAIILAALATLTIAISGYAGANWDADRGSSTFPTGSVQHSTE